MVNKQINKCPDNIHSMALRECILMKKYINIPTIKNTKKLWPKTKKMHADDKQWAGTEKRNNRREGEGVVLSTTVVASRRTLHSKVSTQRVFQHGGEHWRCINLLVLATSPADRCTQVIYFSPPHLTGRLLPITQGRGSAGFLVWQPLLLDAAHRGSIPRCASHFNSHHCEKLGTLKMSFKIIIERSFFKKMNWYKCKCYVMILLLWLIEV